MSAAFEVRIEWLDAPGVTTPELASTWARHEIWVGGRCVTQVEATDGTFRRSVYGSLYPLAEWVASNWWLLEFHIRPSAVEARYWTWSNVRTHRWLSRHNLRGAGDGMAWPDLTIVPEGPVTQVVWMPDTEYRLRPIRFASGGREVARGEEVLDGLARFVDNVLGRLAEEGLTATGLAEEWAAVTRTENDERDFCRAAARLGLDPYSIGDQTTTEIIEVASGLPEELVEDFFDSADPDSLVGSAEAMRWALSAANEASAEAAEELRPLYEAVSAGVAESAPTTEKPWTVGYAMARRVRQELSVPDAEPFDVTPWVGVSDVEASAKGIQGVAAVERDRCGLVLGGRRPLAKESGLFGRARALGRVLARPRQHAFVLSAARGYDERIARAFAAELLAPADGIRRSLDDGGGDDEAALEAVASHYRVSPFVVRHQYDNQIARTSDRNSW